MIRYLLHLSYIGTHFKGVNMLDKFYYYGDARMIQGVMEKTVSSILREKCEIGYAGRTDARVHATSTYFHVDYKGHDRRSVDTTVLMAAINTELLRKHLAIRVNSVELVDPNVFEAHRNVRRRGYLYRLAVRNQNTDSLSEAIFPIEEVDRCYFIDSPNFDVERMKDVAMLIVGKHDFQSFMKWSPDPRTHHPSYAHRHLLSLRVDPGKPCVTAYNQSICNEHFQFYDIHFRSAAFIYRQIRRIVGVLFAAADGRLTKRNVYEMLTIPSHEWWRDFTKRKLVQDAPAHGLYLSRI